MNAKVRAVMAANHGLITRAQLMDAGVWTAQITHLIRQRELVVVRRGSTPTPSCGTPWRPSRSGTASAPGPRPCP